MTVDLIGQGWKFPTKINPQGGLSYSSGPDRLQDSIWIILSTSLGERVMRPAFGGGIHEYVFQPNSPVVQTQLAASVREALVKWEPRIEVTGVRVAEGDQPSLALISIDYLIRSTNEIFNLVFPLYLQEGAG